MVLIITRSVEYPQYTSVSPIPSQSIQLSTKTRCADFSDFFWSSFKIWSEILEGGFHLPRSGLLQPDGLLRAAKMWDFYCILLWDSHIESLVETKSQNKRNSPHQVTTAPVAEKMRRAVNKSVDWNKLAIISLVGCFCNSCGDIVLWKAYLWHLYHLAYFTVWGSELCIALSYVETIV